MRLPVLLVALLATPPAVANEKLGPLVRPLGKAVVDWQEGVVTARAGAAADLRLPGVDAPRVGAVRVARGKAAAVLRAALVKLPLGGGRKTAAKHIDAALERGQILEPQFQSNGGVLLAVGVRFDDLTAPPTAAPAGKPVPPAPAKAPASVPAPTLVLAIASMPLEVAPVVLAGGKPHQLATAVYRVGRPPKGTTARAVRRDRKGRLVLSGPVPDGLEGGRALIYVRTPGRR